MHLTDEQQRIIQHQQGHAKVIAVAGAGKTSTLSLFIQHKLLSGQNPRRMLVIMYNKSAQREFEQKLTGLLQQDSGFVSARPQIRTFHSLGLKIYQSLIREGVLPAFEGDLLGQGETEAVLWQLMQKAAPNREIAKDILEQKKKWVEPMVSFMDRVKAELDPAAVIYAQLDLPKQCDFFPKVFDQFERWRKQKKRISYNDMLYDPCQLFCKRPDVATRFANHMDWILVDEYQDINPVQQFLLQTLAGERSQVMVIGDPDQTIYEFRGSRPEFMQSLFDKTFSTPERPVVTYTLSQTFRYGHEVSLLANQLIQHNPHRQPVLCLSHMSTPQTQVFHHAYEDYAQKTLAIIQHSLHQHPAHHIAVLNRLWGISAPIELALLQADIPYQLDHPGWVLERMELQPFMLLLEMGAGVFAERTEHQRQQAWLTLLTLPYLKVKRSLLEHVAYVMGQAEGNFSQFFSSQTFDDLTPWQLTQVETRIELAHLAEGNRIQAHQLMDRHIRETDFYKGLSDSAFSKQQVDDRVATVQAFVRFVARLNGTPADVYEQVQALKARKLAQQNSQRNHGAQQNDCVFISSIHKAKGLEWPVVIVPGLTEYYYPYQAEGEFSTAASEESERRLLYVAMTRAKQALHLITPPEQGSSQAVSPFMAEAKMQDSKALARAFYQASHGQANSMEPTIEVSKAAYSISEQYLRWLQQSTSLPALNSIQLRQRKMVKPSFSQQRAKEQRLNQQSTKQQSSQGSKRAHSRFQNQNQNANQAQTQTATPIRHQKFGPGHIQQEDDRYYHIVFDDGQKRVLDKTIAASAIEWL